MNIREKLQAENPDVKLLFMTEEIYDKAIIDVGTHIDNSTGKEVKAVRYNTNKVIEANMESGMTEEEAWDWYGYNQQGAYVGEQTPIFVEEDPDVVKTEYIGVY